MFNEEAMKVEKPIVKHNSKDEDPTVPTHVASHSSKKESFWQFGKYDNSMLAADKWKNRRENNVDEYKSQQYRHKDP